MTRGTGHSGAYYHTSQKEQIVTGEIAVYAKFD